MFTSGKKYNKKLLFTSSAIVVAVFCLGVGLPESFSHATAWLKQNITLYFGPWFILLICGLTFLYGFIALSRYGKLKLGLAGETPEFSNFSWFAMLFSCGIGVGFLFWGIAEPMTHFMVASPHNPHPLGDPAGYVAAMKIAIFHWGIYGWVGYMALGVPIGYFAYRYNLPLTTSSALFGLLGRRLKGPWGLVADLVAIFATVFGVATTMGMGLMTMSYGIAAILGVTVTNALLVILMVILVLCYMASAASGIHKGVKRLSNLNIYICLALMVFILLAGPTRMQINLMLETTGAYLSEFIYLGFYAGTSGEYDTWVSGWTIFYWCWFLSWGPFVGGFIARISRGRSLREYILGAIVLPTVFTLLWFCVLGGSAMYYEANNIIAIWPVLEDNLGAGVFILLQALPLPEFFSLVVLGSLLLFLITTADSASILCAVMVCQDKREPSVAMRCFWALLIGAIGVVLLITGGLSSVQSSCIVAALPLSLIVLLANISLVRAMFRYELKDKSQGHATPYESVDQVREDIDYLRSH